MTADAFVDSDDSDSNWAKSTKKSYKECIKSTEAFSGPLSFLYQDIAGKDNKTAVYVDCAATGEQKISADADAARFGVNNHWYRNFETNQPDTDMQLSFTDDATKERPIFGFYAQYGRSAGDEPADRTCTKSNGKVCDDED